MPKKKTTGDITPTITPLKIPEEKEFSEPIKEEPKEIKQPKQPRSTTKTILFVTWFMFIALVVLQVLGYEMGVPLEIIGGVMTTVITAGYLWKSKAENKLKITIAAMESLADKYGIENVIPLVQEIVDD